MKVDKSLIKLVLGLVSVFLSYMIDIIAFVLQHWRMVDTLNRGEIIEEALSNVLKYLKGKVAEVYLSNREHSLYNLHLSLSK